MLDIKRFRNDLNTVVKDLERRGFVLDVGRFEHLEGQRKELQVETEKVQELRNKKSKEIGTAKSAGIDIKEMLSSVENLSGALKELNQKFEEVQKQFLAHQSSPGRLKFGG